MHTHVRTKLFTTICSIYSVSAKIRQTDDGYIYIYISFICCTRYKIRGCKNQIDDRCDLLSILRVILYRATNTDRGEKERERNIL